MPDEAVGRVAYDNARQALDGAAQFDEPDVTLDAWTLRTLLAAHDHAEAMLAACRKIRRYTAFVLAGDENADVQLAADAMKAKVDALTAEVAALRADRERLDWLQHAVPSGEFRASVLRTMGSELPAPFDIRVALDAAKEGA